MLTSYILTNKYMALKVMTVGIVKDYCLLGLHRVNSGKLYLTLNTNIYMNKCLENGIIIISTNGII
jgi:hypothetical protein